MATVSSAVASIPSPVLAPWLTSPQTPTTTLLSRELAVLLKVGSYPNTPTPLDPLLCPWTPIPILAVASPTTPLTSPTPIMPTPLLSADTAAPVPNCDTLTISEVLLPLKLAVVPETKPLAVMLPVTVWFPVLTLPVKFALAPDTEPVALRLPFTSSLPVTVGRVCPVAKVMMPLLLMERPVSVGVAEPEANSRLNLPEGLAVLFATGSACQRKCWLTAAWLLLLKEEASASSGWELNPCVAVAVPVAGNCSVPRMVAPPFTSSFAAGVVVPIPMLLFGA